MENILRAEKEGVIAKINAAEGESLAVDSGDSRTGVNGLPRREGCSEIGVEADGGIGPALGQARSVAKLPQNQNITVLADIAGP